MPTRIIRDGILTSERVNLLSANAELFYRRLMSVADDYGRFSANLMLLRASCYPLKLDSVKEDSIKKHLAECVGAGLIVLYTFEGKPYLEMQDFGQRINGKSKYPPAPDEFHRELRGFPGVSRLGEGEGEGVSEGVSEPAKPPAPKPARPAKTLLPADFRISESVKAWAESKGHTRLAEHLESFVSKAKAKAYTYADWDQAFMNAIRDDWANLGKSAAPKRRKQLGEGSSTNYGLPS